MKETNTWQDSLSAINNYPVQLPNSQSKRANTLFLWVLPHQTWLRLAYPRIWNCHCIARRASSAALGRYFYLHIYFLAAGHSRR